MAEDIIKRYGVRGKGYSYRDNSLIKGMKAIHMLASIAWGGGAFAMQALGFLRRSLPPGKMAEDVAYCAHFVDTWVVMPGLAGCILTGLFYSMFTAIGFFRFAWIGYKWLIAMSAAFWGTLFWGPWGNELIVACAPLGLDGLLLFIRGCILPENIWAALMQTCIILSMCLISVYRPLSFRFWRRDTEAREVERRTREVLAADKIMNHPSPLDNPQVAALYDNWLGAPLGPQSKKLLHSRLRDKSARLDKLRRAGLYPENLTQAEKPAR